MRRRAFIQNGAAATVAATALTQATSVAQDNKPGTRKPLEVPKRVLGKTGAEVTILNGGTARAPGALDRLLRFEYSRGVRFYDTAADPSTSDVVLTAAVSLDEARWLVQECNRTKAVYSMAENCIYMRPNVLVSSMVEAGLFGSRSEYSGAGSLPVIVGCKLGMPAITNVTETEQTSDGMLVHKMLEKGRRIVFRCQPRLCGN